MSRTGRAFAELLGPLLLLAIFGACHAVAQAGGPIGPAVGPIDPSVGPIDRSIGGAVGGGGSGSGAGKAAARQEAMDAWGINKSVASSVSHSASGITSSVSPMARTEEQPEAGQGESGPGPFGQQKSGGQRSGSAGVRPGGGLAGASSFNSFGGSPDKFEPGFGNGLGKNKPSIGGWRIKPLGPEQSEIANEMESHSTTVFRSKKRAKRKAFRTAPKELRSPDDCAGASMLHLCTWF